MLRHCVTVLLLTAVVCTASIAIATDAARRPQASAQVGIPQGDPLTNPLALSTAERSLFIDVSDGRFDEHSLIEAALVACGDENPAAVARYRRQFATVCDELRQANIPTADIAGQIELIHRLLHQRLLRGGYDANATDLAGTFDTGIYNCASATLLFVALAEQVNLNAHAIELPGHVRAVIDFGAQRCEVEVTSPAWLGAVHWESFSRVARDALPVTDGTPTREVAPPGLVAMIYYNRGVDAFYHQRFADAVALNRKALVLDPANATARGNLLAAVNNWALTLAAAGRFNEAQNLLAAGARFAPEHLPFRHNAAHIQRLRAQATPGQTTT